MTQSDSINSLAREMASARSLVVITGAGVSAESGISTFRGAGGYWNRFRAEELASPQGFARDPELVWRWYDARRRQILAAEPNPGHAAIAALEGMFEDFLLITQNVDGLHRVAGSRQLLEIHGSIWRVRCTRSGEEWENRQVYQDFPPRCCCGALLRPAVLWFGENYDPQLFNRALAAASKAEFILVAGTSGRVWIVSGLIDAAPGAKVAEFNLEATETGQQADYLILGPSGQTLPRLVEQLKVNS